MIRGPATRDFEKNRTAGRGKKKKSYKHAVTGTGYQIWFCPVRPQDSRDAEMKRVSSTLSAADISNAFVKAVEELDLLVASQNYVYWGFKLDSSHSREWRASVGTKSSDPYFFSPFLQRG